MVTFIPQPRPPSRRQLRIGVCILAGGRSSRMGRDKAALRLGGRSLLSVIREIARSTGWTVRVIRRDSRPGHGPLGGIHEALRTSRMDAELILACDMPWVRRSLLRRVAAALGARHVAVFTAGGDEVGFPLVLRVSALEAVERELAGRRLSLQNLRRILKARVLRLQGRQVRQLLNINTPVDWAKVQGRTQAGRRGDAVRAGRADKNISARL